MRHIHMLSLVLWTAQDLLYFVLFGLLFGYWCWSKVGSFCDHYGLSTGCSIDKRVLCYHLRPLLLDLFHYSWC